MTVLLLATLAAAGCAEPEDAGDGVASVGGATPSASASAADGPAKGDALKHAQCMRENGMTWFKDPEPGQRGVRIAVPPGQDRAKVDAAMEACKKYLPNGGEPGRMDPAAMERARQMSKCMRENGVPDFPDPGPDGGIRIEKGKGKGGLGPGDPAFEAAQEACAQFRPSGAPERQSSRS
jgi:hypothetical protein